MSGSIVIIGADPGLSGGIGIITPEAYTVHPIPVLIVEGARKRSIRTGQMVTKMRKHYDLSSIRRILLQVKDAAHDKGYPVELWCEDVHPMPEEGVMGAFSLGKGVMLWEAAAEFLGFRFSKIHPRTWKQEIMGGMGKEKEAAVYRAQQLFPNVCFIGPKGGKKDGLAEALLIAEYGRRKSIMNSAELPF